MWRLPLAAASFWAGILLLGDRLGGGWGAGLLVTSVGLVAGVARAGRRRDGGACVLERAGLGAPVGPRERVLAAAGLLEEREATGRRLRDARGLRAAALAAALLAMGGGWAAVRTGSVPEVVALDGRTVPFLATAASDVRRFDRGWGLEAEVRAGVDDRSARTIAFRAWLGGRGDPPGAMAGQRLRGRGSVRPVMPGESGFADYLARRGVVATVALSDLRVLGPPASPALRLANAARRLLDRGAARVLPEREAGLLLGLTIGDTSRMDPEVEEDFRATGLGHLVAVSGSNVAMVLAPALGLATLARGRSGVRFLVGLSIVAFFVLVTRWEPSVLRASVMASLAMLGTLAGRPRDTANLLAAAVLLLLAVDPRIAHALAFQLSVAATAGIVALAPRIAGRLGWLPRPLALATAATVGAQAGVTPLLLLSFGVVPGVALPANILAFPAVAPAFLGGVGAAAAGLAWEPLGRMLGKVASAPLAYLSGVADHMARLPLPSLVGLRWVVPAALLGLALLAVLRSPLASASSRAVAVAVVLPVVLWAAVLRGGPPPGLTVIFFDVGQGDAALVRTPEGVNVLIDAGPEERLVATRLAALGVGRLDLAVASHAHADHVAGFPAVLARHPVGLLLEAGCPSDSAPYDRFLEAARAEDVPVRRPRGGVNLRLGALRVEVLGPDGCAPDSPNDDSIVLLLTYEGTDYPGAAVLFPGDAEVPAQRDLLYDGDPVAADVLKVPHHGGATSDPAFFRAVGAGLAVVSVGENEYGHPAPEMLEALREAGTTVIRTDRVGDVTVRFGPGGVRVESAAR